MSSRKLEAFAVLMNLRAEKLGCKGTHFVNACGLPDNNHYTTAYDLTLIMAAAAELEDFRTLISAPSHVFIATNRHKSDAWSYVKNSNYLLYDPGLHRKQPTEPIPTFLQSSEVRPVPLLRQVRDLPFTL